MSAEQDWCLVEPIPEERLMCINTHVRMKPRQEEEQRLKDLSAKTVAKYNITPQKFLSLLQELDEYCNDGIQDSVCANALTDECRCMVCKERYHAIEN